jgi:hypothetical protein
MTFLVDYNLDGYALIFLFRDELTDGDSIQGYL